MAVTSFGMDVRFGARTVCQVLLNKVTVTTKSSSDPEAHSLALQHEVIPGKNTIEFLIGGAEIPPTSGQTLSVPNAEGFFLEADLDREEVEDRGAELAITTIPLQDLVWRPEGSITLPHKETLIFDAPPGPSRPAWMDAEDRSDGDVMGAVNEVLRELHNALSVRDFDRYQELIMLRNKDMALAYPYDGTSEERAQIDTAMLQDIMADGSKLAPLDPNLDITLEADGRLILANTKSGQAPLRIITSPGAEEIELPTGFAQVGGEMRVIR